MARRTKIRETIDVLENNLDFSKEDPFFLDLLLDSLVAGNFIEYNRMKRDLLSRVEHDRDIIMLCDILSLNAMELANLHKIDSFVNNLIKMIDSTLGRAKMLLVKLLHKVCKIIEDSTEKQLLHLSSEFESCLLSSVSKIIKNMNHRGIPNDVPNLIPQGIQDIHGHISDAPQLIAQGIQNISETLQSADVPRQTGRHESSTSSTRSSQSSDMKNPNLLICLGLLAMCASTAYSSEGLWSAKHWLQALFASLSLIGSVTVVYLSIACPGVLMKAKHILTQASIFAATVFIILIFGKRKGHTSLLVIFAICFCALGVVVLHLWLYHQRQKRRRQINPDIV